MESGMVSNNAQPAQRLCQPRSSSARGLQVANVEGMIGELAGSLDSRLNTLERLASSFGNEERRLLARLQAERDEYLRILHYLTRKEFCFDEAELEQARSGPSLRELINQLDDEPPTCPDRLIGPGQTE